jgi:hypothetical protein
MKGKLKADETCPSAGTGQLWVRLLPVRAADTSFFSWTIQVRNYSLLCSKKNKEKPVAKK